MIVIRLLTFSDNSSNIIFLFITIKNKRIIGTTLTYVAIIFSLGEV